MKINKLNRKGQFYIFMALLLCSLVFTMFPSSLNTVIPIYLFQSTTQNYIKEAPKVVNAAVFQKDDLFQVFEEYTQEFIGYADTKNLDFEVAYIIINKTNIKIVNYLSAPINVLIGSDDWNIEDESFIIVNRDDEELEVEFAGKKYHYQITKEDLQLKFLVRTVEK